MDVVCARTHQLGTYLQTQLRSIPGITVLTPARPDMYCGMVTFRCQSVPYDELFGFLLGGTT